MSPASPARMPPPSCVGQPTPCSTPRLRAHQEPGGRGRTVDPALRRRPERACVASSPSRPTRRSVPSEVPNRVNRTTVTTGQSTGVWWHASTPRSVSDMGHRYKGRYRPRRQRPRSGLLSVDMARRRRGASRVDVRRTADRYVLRSSDPAQPQSATATRRLRGLRRGSRRLHHRWRRRQVSRRGCRCCRRRPRRTHLVVAAAAAGRVTAWAAANDVVSAAAIDHVSTTESADHVSAFGAGQHVTRRGASDRAQRWWCTPRDTTRSRWPGG